MKDKLVVVAGGTGRLGRLIVEALLTHPSARVRVLARDPKKPEVAALAGERVELAAFDATSADAAMWTSAVRGAFSVISALQGFGPDILVDAQLALLRAAKTAGARRFIPSDFAYNLFALPPGINVHSDLRRAFGERARPEQSGAFEIVHVLQGMFFDRAALGFLGLFDGHTLRYWGDGTTPIDWTTWEDTARFTAAAALDERRVPERLFVSGDRQSILSVAQTWESVCGKKLDVVRLGSLDELERETRRLHEGEPQNVLGWLPLMYARGVFSGQALLGPSHNGLYSDIHPLTIAEAISKGVM